MITRTFRRKSESNFLHSFQPSNDLGALSCQILVIVLLSLGVKELVFPDIVCNPVFCCFVLAAHLNVSLILTLDFSRILLIFK